MKLERPPLQKAVYFRDGQILFAASNDPKDQLASILVEEGRLGPDQMQVAQARVSPGNPLAKVLTDLGYISQRELAEAARWKVEKILTDLFSWKEGNYTFAPGALPKGAINLELSTRRLLFNSIRHIQDREWVLQELGSLDVVLAPGAVLDSFLAEVQPDDNAADVLKFADGVKTIKQIAALSVLSEFDVCKIMAAGLLLGALEKQGPRAVEVSEDPFAGLGEGDPTVEEIEIAPEPEPAAGTILFPPPSGSAPSPEATFAGEIPPEPAPNEPEPPRPEPPPRAEPPPPPPPRPALETTAPERPRPPTPTPRFDASSTRAADLLIDEPESEASSDELITRVPRRPRRSGRSVPSRDFVKPLAAVAAVAILGAAAYYFVWPLVGGAGDDTAESSAAPPSLVHAMPAGSETSEPEPENEVPHSPPEPDGGPSSTPPETGGPAETTSPSTAPISPPAPSPPQPTPSAPPPNEAPPSTPTAPAEPTTGLAEGRSLLREGRFADSAAAFLRHVRREASGKFTIAIVSYCDLGNVTRAVRGAGDSENLLLLPFSESGRACYRVVWGIYDSQAAAARALTTVPAAIRQPDSQPVPFAPLIR